MWGWEFGQTSGLRSMFNVAMRSGYIADTTEGTERCSRGHEPRRGGDDRHFARSMGISRTTSGFFVRRLKILSALIRRARLFRLCSSHVTAIHGTSHFSLFPVAS